MADLALPFQTVVLVYPAITAAHVLEEWPRFVAWAQRFASERYSRRDYVTTHVMALVFSIAATATVRRFPGTMSTAAFFALFFGPSIACNAVFHVAETAVTRTYCPGVATSVVLYLPAAALVTQAALRERLLDASGLAAIAVFAASFHVIEVGHNVFKRW
jgi:uncharacterized protein with HXXEE motif